MFSKIFKLFYPNHKQSDPCSCISLTPQEVKQLENAFNIPESIRDKLYKLEENKYIFSLTITEFKILCSAFNMPDSIKEKITQAIDEIRV